MPATSLGPRYPSTVAGAPASSKAAEDLAGTVRGMRACAAVPSADRPGLGARWLCECPGPSVVRVSPRLTRPQRLRAARFEPTQVRCPGPPRYAWSVCYVHTSPTSMADRAARTPTPRSEPHTSTDGLGDRRPAVSRTNSAPPSSPPASTFMTAADVRVPATRTHRSTTKRPVPTGKAAQRTPPWLERKLPA